MCAQRLHAANAELLALLRHLRSTLDACCEEARAGEARMAGVEEAVTDPHTLLLQVYRALLIYLCREPCACVQRGRLI